MQLNMAALPEVDEQEKPGPDKIINRTAICHKLLGGKSQIFVLHFYNDHHIEVNKYVNKKIQFVTTHNPRNVNAIPNKLEKGDKFIIKDVSYIVDRWWWQDKSEQTKEQATKENNVYPKQGLDNWLQMPGRDY